MLQVRPCLFETPHSCVQGATSLNADICDIKKTKGHAFYSYAGSNTLSNAQNSFHSSLHMANFPIPDPPAERRTHSTAVQGFSLTPKFGSTGSIVTLTWSLPFLRLQSLLMYFWIERRHSRRFSTYWVLKVCILRCAFGSTAMTKSISSNL